MHRKSYYTSPGMGIGGIGISKMLVFMLMFFLVLARGWQVSYPVCRQVLYSTAFLEFL